MGEIPGNMYNNIYLKRKKKPVQMASNKKALEKMWRKENPCALLMGM